MKLHLANRKLDKLKANLMYIGIITIITVLVWMGVSIYSSYSKKTIDPNIQAIIKPINPRLDSPVLINFSTSRVRPPEQFQIVSLAKEGNKITEVVFDPYARQTSQKVASSSGVYLPSNN